MFNFYILTDYLIFPPDFCLYYCGGGGGGKKKKEGGSFSFRNMDFCSFTCLSNMVTSQFYTLLDDI